MNLKHYAFTVTYKSPPNTMTSSDIQKRKRHKKVFEVLNTFNMVQLPIWFTPVVVFVEKKFYAVLSLISINKFFCLKFVVLLSSC